VIFFLNGNLDNYFQDLFRTRSIHIIDEFIGNSSCLNMIECSQSPLNFVIHILYIYKHMVVIDKYFRYLLLLLNMQLYFLLLVLQGEIFCG
jgi:hypothetical protein